MFTLKPCAYLETNDILTIDFEEVMINENAVPRSRRVFHDRRDLVVLEHKPHVTGAVLLQCDGSLERSGKRGDVISQ